jgi:hypothetical protein
MGGGLSYLSTQTSQAAALQLILELGIRLKIRTIQSAVKSVLPTLI